MLFSLLLIFLYSGSIKADPRFKKSFLVSAFNSVSTNATQLRLVPTLLLKEFPVNESTGTDPNQCQE